MIFLLSFLFALPLCACASDSAPAPAPVPVLEEVIEDEDDEVWDAEPEGGYPEYDGRTMSFDEIWCYLTAGREQALKPGYPITDLVYFGAEVDSYGKLTGVPDRRKLKGFPGRVHMALVCNSRGLAHFVLESGSAPRRQLIADLLSASENFDGLQIDLELIPARDGANFLSFLSELRTGLGNKMFTIALPARRRVLAQDVFDYGRIAPLVDRIFVMAYDEHWSGSDPGPIASLDWCRSVAAHGLNIIGPEKLIMGMPFYGRTWGSFNPSRAFFHSGIERIREEQEVAEVERKRGVPTFSYETSITVTVYYEDVHSVALKAAAYQELGVAALGFWTLGQEDPRVWSALVLSEK
jgi:hypothetical protein